MAPDKYRGMTDHDLLIHIATKSDGYGDRLDELEDEDKVLHSRITRLNILAAMITALSGVVILIIKVWE